MNRSIAITSLSLLLASLSGPVLAQDKPAATPVRPQPNPANATFTAWDTDRNGSLSPQEFRTGWQQASQARQVQARLRQQFATIDANKSGAIEASEYGSLLLIKQAGKAAPPLARFDANKDGKLQPGEYVQLVATMAPPEAARGTSK